MKLKIEDLKVESFETESNKKSMKGTVKGYNTIEPKHTDEPTCADTCEVKLSYYGSCYYTCQENCTERCTL